MLLDKNYGFVWNLVFDNGPPHARYKEDFLVDLVQFLVVVKILSLLVRILI
jgi:hypothetical protein